MDIDQARQEILQWIQDFVGVENPAPKTLAPCPHARTIRANDRIEIRAGGADPYVDLRALTDLSACDLIILVYDADMFSAAEFNDLVTSANPAFMVGRGFIAQANYPESQDVSMNQGQYAMVFVRNLDKPNRFARQIVEKRFCQD